MTCLENIIGIKNCDSEQSMSGYFMLDYPGITIQQAANNADEKTLSGYNFLKDIRRRAVMRLNADVLNYINQEYRLSSVVTNSFASGQYNTPLSTVSTVSAETRRGMVVSKLKYWCRFHSIVINRIRIYSNQDVDTILHITDVAAGVTYPAAIHLEAGVIKEFTVNKVITGSEAHITLPGNISLYSNKPDCGCGGKAKNDYLKFQGITGTSITTSEAYGIECDVTLRCDISNLICDMAQDGLIGQALYELCGAMFYDEMTKNNRLNYLTIYKGEQIMQQASAGFATYKGYFENIMRGMRDYLRKSDGNCKCIDCDGFKVKSNI